MAGKGKEKTEGQIAAEKAEIAQLSESILRMISRIPDRVVNGSSSQLVRQYKKAVDKARTAATNTIPNLGRLRDAHSLIRSFYL